MNAPNPRLAYRQAAAQTATPLGLVVLLYDQAIDDLRRAVAALEVGDVEARTGHVNHFFAVQQELQGRLDFERGADVAKQLDKFYSMIGGKVLEAQIKQSKEIFEEVLGYVNDMRAAWKQVEEQQLPKASEEQTTAAAANWSSSTAAAFSAFEPTSTSAWTA